MKPPVINVTKKELKKRTKLVQPNLGTTPKKAMQNMHGGRIEDRLIGYYETKGLLLPDLSKKSKIEKLRILAEMTAKKEKLTQKASNQIIQHNKKQEDEYKAKKAAKQQQQPPTTNT